MNSKKTIEKTKLIKLLSSFSTLEWKRFGRFVQSPFFNTNQPIIQLYQVLKKAAPFDNLKELEEGRVYKKVYGKGSFNIIKFRNLTSDLYLLAEEFIIHTHLGKEKRKKEKLLIDALAERNYELFKGKSQQLIKEIETQDYFLDETDFLLLHQLNDGLWHHLEKDKFANQKPELEKSWKNLNAFQENSQLQIIAENSSAQNFLNQINESADLNTPHLSELFQLAIQLHQSKQTPLYFKMKEKVLGCWNKLKIKHKTNLLVHLLNFSVTNGLIQQEFGYTESFALYKLGLKENLFIIDGKMRDVEFFNISSIALKLKEYEWTNSFIEKYQKYLSSEIRSFLVPLVYAYHANFQKNHNLVIKLLATLNPINQLQYLPKIKSLLIRAYFEGVVKGQEQYRSPLDYEIDSFKKMMTRNNKLSQLKTESYINYLSLTKKLLKLFTKKSISSNELVSFKLLLSNTKPIALRHWFDEKVEEIKNVASL